MTPTCTLIRQTSTDMGTFGRLLVPGWTQSPYSGELPWRENKVKMSSVPTSEWCVDRGRCLPEGLYRCVMRLSGHLGWTYWLTNTPDRTFCLIHPATYMGDTEKGFRTQLQGCISLGYSIGMMDGQLAILRSRVAVVGMQDFLQRQPFNLRIVNILKGD